MPKKKKKSVRKNKKKPTRRAKRSRGMTSARKKTSVTSRNSTVGVLEVEVSHVEVSTNVEDIFDSGETGTNVGDDLDEHFPPDIGGSE